MLEIDKILDGGHLTVVPVGRIDTLTAPDLDELLRESAASVEAITVDMAEATYISSAGIRALLRAAKAVDDFELVNVTENVQDVLEMAGVDMLLTIR